MIKVRWNQFIGLFFLVLGMVFYSFNMSLAFTICQMIIGVCLIAGLNYSREDKEVSK